jgi:hypothetical protein
VTLPEPEPERSRVMAVRRGERSFNDVEIADGEGRLDIALERTESLESPDDEAVNAFLVDAHRQSWGRRRPTSPKASERARYQAMPRSP